MILQTQQSDPLSIILNILFFIMIFISMFYGTKLQAYRSQKNLESALEKFKKWDDETRALAVRKFKKFCDENLTVKDIESKIEDFMNFITIQPTTLDPAGIVPKIDHIMDVRENRFLDEVKDIAVNADERNLHNLENLLEATMAVHQIYRILLHYLLLGKKSKSYIILLQVEMQLKLFEALAKAYVSASKAFAEGSPIGDALGPMVVSSFIRDVNGPSDLQYEDIAYQTIRQTLMFENREIHIIRAKGPGGTVGKPGEAIQKTIDELDETLKLVIMIDAGLKMEGDRTGSIVIGVGAAIGGIGVEKFKIEDSVSQRKIPVNAIVCRQSLEDAICTMKKSIVDSVPEIIDKVKQQIRKQTREGDKVILAGIGNTIGIGI